MITALLNYYIQYCGTKNLCCSLHSRLVWSLSIEHKSHFNFIILDKIQNEWNALSSNVCHSLCAIWYTPDCLDSQLFCMPCKNNRQSVDNRIITFNSIDLMFILLWMSALPAFFSLCSFNSNGFHRYLNTEQSLFIHGDKKRNEEQKIALVYSVADRKYCASNNIAMMHFVRCLFCSLKIGKQQYRQVALHWILDIHGWNTCHAMPCIVPMNKTLLEKKNTVSLLICCNEMSNKAFNDIIAVAPHTSTKLYTFQPCSRNW